MGQAIFGGDAARFPVTDAGVVNHRVEKALSVDLFGDAAGLCDAGQIAGDDGLGLRNCGKRFHSSPLIARV